MMEKIYKAIEIIGLVFLIIVMAAIITIMIIILVSPVLDTNEEHLVFNYQHGNFFGYEYRKIISRGSNLYLVNYSTGFDSFPTRLMNAFNYKKVDQRILDELDAFFESNNLLHEKEPDEKNQSLGTNNKNKKQNTDSQNHNLIPVDTEVDPPEFYLLYKSKTGITIKSKGRTFGYHNKLIELLDSFQ